MNRQFAFISVSFSLSTRSVDASVPGAETRLSADHQTNCSDTSYCPSRILRSSEYWLSPLGRLLHVHELDHVVRLRFVREIEHCPRGEEAVSLGKDSVERLL